jgi:hypothetical protein
MKNIQISPPQADRKIARPASVIFMGLAWVFLVGFWTWAFIDGNPETWGVLEYALVCISVLAFLFIPLQLVCYIREKQR